MSDDTYLMLVDGEVQAVDLGPMMRRHRAAHVEAQAGPIDQAADLFGDSAFDPAETYDACEAAGMPNSAVNAAAHVAVTLREIELGGGALP